MRIKKILIIPILVSHSFILSAQCDDGWFSHRLEAGIVSRQSIIDYQICYTSFYNFENHWSSGLQTGLVFTKPSNLIELSPHIKYRFTNLNTFRPFIETGYGFQFATQKDKEGRTVFSPSIGLETSTLKRQKLSIKLSSEIYRFAAHHKPKNKLHYGYSLNIGIII